MLGTCLANIGYPLGQVLVVGALACFAVATLFVRATARRDGERERRLGLGCLCFPAGILLGLALAGSAHASGQIHPADIDYTYEMSASVGGFAGIIAGLIFAMTSILSSNQT